MPIWVGGFQGVPGGRAVHFVFQVVGFGHVPFGQHASSSQPPVPSHVSIHAPDAAEARNS